MFLTRSKNLVPIRLTGERLDHISRNHPELFHQEEKVLETVSDPDFIQQGDEGTRLAVRLYPKTPLTRKYLIVVYREFSNDGFILTAYFASEPAKWREILWKP